MLTAQAAAVNVLQGLGAQQVKQLADSLDSEIARTALHGILACGGAAAKGADCSSAAMGAGASVVLNNLIDQIYGTDASKLNDAERQARINIVTTLVDGIASASGLNTAGTDTAAKLEGENNYAMAIPAAIEVGSTLYTLLAGTSLGLLLGLSGDTKTDETPPVVENPPESFPANDQPGGYTETYPAEEDLSKSSLETYPYPDTPSHDILPGSEVADVDDGNVLHTIRPENLKFDDKINGQMGTRGWSEQGVKDVVAQGAKGTSIDNTKDNNGVRKNDTATVYGSPGNYVVINDRTKEVIQVSDKNDPEWADDGRIKWSIKP